MFSQKSQKGTNNEGSEKKTDLAKSPVREVCDLRLLNIAQLFLAIIIQNSSDNVVTVSQRAIIFFAQKTKKMTRAGKDQRAFGVEIRRLSHFPVEAT